MIALSEFAPDIAAEVPGCPSFIVKRAVLGAAIEFAERSWCLNEEHDDFDLEADTAEYDLDTPAFHIIIGIMNLRIDGEAIDSSSERELGQECADWRSKTAPLPTQYVKISDNTVRLYPTPDGDVTDAVAARIAIAPKRDATRIADRFYNYHYDAIVAGASARLMLQPGKEWSNPDLASVAMAVFTQAIYTARNVVMREIMQARPEKPGF